MGKIVHVNLPDIGEGVVEGEVIQWLKEEGEPVAQDEPVVVVMTDKATVELPSPHPGVVAKHYYRPGGIAQRDQPLYDLELVNGEAPSHQQPSAPPPKAKQEPSRPKQVARSVPAPIAAGEGQVLATPAVRRMARELGVNISGVKGSGKEGRVTVEDVKSRVSADAGGKRSQRARPPVNGSTPLWELEGDTRVPLIGFRNYIAEKMVEAKYLVPHFAYFDRLDASRLVQARERMKKEAEGHGVHLTFMPFFIRALSLCLKEFPQFNSSVDLQSNEQVFHRRQNMGLAMRTDQGLIVPVLKDVQDMGFHDIIQAYDRLRQKMLTNQLESQDMKESTITISNYGSEGGQWATPIINYPEVCILGLARISPEAVVRGDQVVARKMLNLSWCCDHRVIDGDMVANLSNLFIRLLENPANLF